MKIPFFKKRKKKQYIVSPSPSKPSKEGMVVRGEKASTFFVKASDDEKDKFLDEVLEEVNKEQKAVVDEFGKVVA